jgi:hypothetical protein
LASSKGAFVSFDHVLVPPLRAFAVRAAGDGKFGYMIAFRVSDLVLVPLKVPTGEIREIPLVS